MAVYRLHHFAKDGTVRFEDFTVKNDAEAIRKAETLNVETHSELWAVARRVKVFETTRPG